MWQDIQDVMLYALGQIARSPVAPKGGFDLLFEGREIAKGNFAIVIGLRYLA